MNLDGGKSKLPANFEYFGVNFGFNCRPKQGLCNHGQPVHSYSGAGTVLGHPGVGIFLGT